MDLADGHVKALNIINNISKVLTINLGTGIGYSVLDIVKSFEKIIGKPIPYTIVPRRSGDIATCFANPAHAKEVLGWEATRGIDEMCKNSWNWQVNNPNGYKKEATLEK